MSKLKIALDTACAGLCCYVCQEEILVGDDMTVVGTGLEYWLAHRDCYHIRPADKWASIQGI